MNQVIIQEREVKMLPLKSKAFLSSLKLGERFNLKATTFSDATKLYANIEAQKVLRRNEHGTSVFAVEMKYNYVDKSKPVKWITLPITELEWILDVGFIHLD